LSAALSAKEVLLKELHHRVKNNLQVISSLLAMQSDALTDAAAQRALEESQRRVQSMALIHERLNREENTEQLEFSEYAQALARELFYSYGMNSDKTLRFDTHPVWLGLSQAIPCGLILNELVSNALKYAFGTKDAGEVLVGVSCDEHEMVRLTVADNGAGLPTGLDWREAPSLGLRIVDILTRQIDGTIEYSTEDGTAFSLAFRRSPACVPGESQATHTVKTIVHSAS